MMSFLMALMSEVNELLLSKQENIVDLDSVVFAFREEVFFDKVCTVTKSYTSKTVQTRLRERIKEGPSWVHINLVRGLAGQNVIVLEFGANVGNPKPTINASYENWEVVLKPI